MMIKRFLRVAAFLSVMGMPFAPAAVFAQQPPQEQQRDFGEYVPFDQLPPSEQLPAAPLLITAYAFAWVAVFFYVWSLWRRLGKVEAEMRALERRQVQRGEGVPGTNRAGPR